jgi:hypothetical protein
LRRRNQSLPDLVVDSGTRARLFLEVGIDLRALGGAGRNGERQLLFVENADVALVADRLLFGLLQRLGLDRRGVAHLVGVGKRVLAFDLSVQFRQRIGEAVIALLLGLFWCAVRDKCRGFCVHDALAMLLRVFLDIGPKFVVLSEPLFVLVGQGRRGRCNGIRLRDTGARFQRLERPPCRLRMVDHVIDPGADACRNDIPGGQNPVERGDSKTGNFAPHLSRAARLRVVRYGLPQAGHHVAERDSHASELLDLPVYLVDALTELKHLLVRKAEVIAIAGQLSAVLHLRLELLESAKGKPSCSSNRGDDRHDGTKRNGFGSGRGFGSTGGFGLRRGERPIGYCSLFRRPFDRPQGLDQSGLRRPLKLGASRTFDFRLGKRDLRLARSNRGRRPFRNRPDRPRRSCCHRGGLGQFRILRNLDDPNHPREMADQRSDIAATILNSGPDPTDFRCKCPDRADAHRQLLSKALGDVEQFEADDPRICGGHAQGVISASRSDRRSSARLRAAAIWVAATADDLAMPVKLDEALAVALATVDFIAAMSR